MIEYLYINDDDSKVLIILKSLYLIPAALLVVYPLEVLYEGRKMVGPFWKPVIKEFKRAYSASGKEVSK